MFYEILILLSLVIGVNVGLTLYLYKRNIEQQKVIESIVQSILSHKSNFELTNKLTLDYLKRLERDVSLLSMVPPSTTVN